MWQQKMSFVFTLLYTRGLDSAIYRVVTEQQEILPISQPSRLRISQAWWNPITYSVVPDKCIPCCGKYYCTLGCARIKWADTHRSLEDPCRNFILLRRNWDYCHNSICQKSLFIYKNWLQGASRTRFSGTVSPSPSPPHSLLSHCPGEMPLLRVWLLGAWWDPGGCSECRGLKEIALSLLLFDSEILNTRGSIQGMMECLTEAAICSQLANRDLFGQWVQPSTQQTSAFRWVHRRKKEML